MPVSITPICQRPAVLKLGYRTLVHLAASLIWQRPILLIPTGGPQQNIFQHLALILFVADVLKGICSPNFA